MKNVYFPDQKLMSSKLVREFSTSSASRLHKKGRAFSHCQRLAAASSIFSLKKNRANSFASSLMNINERLIMEDRNRTISDFYSDVSETASTQDITGLQMVAKFSGPNSQV